MDRELIRDYLQRTEMNEAQADALSRIFAEMATRNDLVSSEERLNGRMASLEARLDARMAELEARLTWRTIAIVGFFATASTLLNAFIG